jgi:uncharacterized protein (DUF1501 family)
MPSLQDITRRAFLRRTGALGFMGAAAPWAATLSTLAEAAGAATTGNDYKALVCVFLAGGNDHGNLLIPCDPGVAQNLDSAYNAYAQARSTLALARDSLAATVLQPLSGVPEGRHVAFPPQWAPLKTLFDNNRLAVLSNIGPLLRPTTLSDFQNNIGIPPRLFSHNDQQATWQSYQPEGGTVGWGGRVGDLLLSSNGTKASFTCINVAGNAVYLSGQDAIPCTVAPGGPEPLLAAGGSLFGSSKASEVFRALVTQQDHPVPMARTHADAMVRGMAAQASLSTALATAPSSLAAHFNTAVNGASRPLALQLLTVARCIAARQTLGVSRQVFFVSLGGFDLHDRMLPDHPRLLEQVAEALVSFDAAMQQLQLGDRVTTFTASDFGRTLTSNGDGSDHGWGGHQLVMGGAVAGRRLYGTLPAAGLAADHVGQGRLLPTTSVDQLAAELARWMGVSESDLALVAPRYKAFDTAVLKGLLARA